MGIPNTIVKIVDKRGEIADFNISKIANSVTMTIIDVENTNKWIAERRAHKYVEIVRKNAYNRFYSLTWLIEDFFKKFINFKPDEKYKRLDNAFVTERLSIVLMDTFRDCIDEGTIEDNRDSLKEYIAKEIEKLEKNFESDLFPVLNGEDKDEVIKFLTEKVIFYSKIDLKQEQKYPARDYLMDNIESTLKAIGEIEVAEGFMIFREGKNKIRNNEIAESQFTNNGIHYDINRKTLEWNISHECESIFSLNDWVYGRNSKDIRELIELSDKRYKEDVHSIASKVLSRRDDIRMIIIAGPSCSNKTTTTVIIEQELSKAGLKLKQLNVDDYFKNLEDQPKDEFGDYDFEMPEAIDMELLNSHFAGLLDGKTIQKPCYDFKTGRRESCVDFSLADDEILLIDCLHGLYRKLTRSVPSANKFSIYIESMNIIRNNEGTYTRWADIRMLKRMIRDVKYRNYSTNQTLAHWPYVRKGELKHIIPYIFSTDAVINSGLPYELPALKQSLDGFMPERTFIEKLLDERRLDPYIRGTRVQALLDTVALMPDLDIIPLTSPLREFIGGSAYVIPHNE
jgi:uridine kinase